MKFREFLDHVDSLTLTEKWGKEDVVNPAKKGMFKGKSKAELKKQLTALKDKQAKRKEAGKKADPETSTKIKEIDFALRAKSGWGKVKEDVLKETGTSLNESAADTYYITSMKNRFAAMEKAVMEDEASPYGQGQSYEAPKQETADDSDEGLAARIEKLEEMMEKIKEKFPDLCSEEGAEEGEDGESEEEGEESSEEKSED